MEAQPLQCLHVFTLGDTNRGEHDEATTHIPARRHSSTVWMLPMFEVYLNVRQHPQHSINGWPPISLRCDQQSINVLRALTAGTLRVWVLMCLFVCVAHPVRLRQDTLFRFLHSSLLFYFIVLLLSFCLPFCFSFLLSFFVLSFLHI